MYIPSLTLTARDKLTSLFLLQFCIIAMETLGELDFAHLRFLSHSVAVKEGFVL